jgi:Type II secretory pathway, ATPase PulE/Tfp pilus assembly pathway, ATPase PilB
MGVEPFLIASTIRIVIAQRLVRKLCPNCSFEIKVDDAIEKQIIKDFNLDQKKDLILVNELEKEAAQNGINPSNNKADKELSSTPQEIKRIWQANKDGCDICNHSGYKGRIGIYEVLPNNENLQHMILENKSSEEIEQNATEEGMVKIRIDGLIKSLRGQTTIEEVLRVTVAD